MSEQDAAGRDSTAGPLQIGQQLYGELQKFYTADSGAPQIDVAHSAYSNVGAVVISPRDLYVDFIEMPPRPSGGRMVAPAVRVYMSHHAAKSLADAILNLIGSASNQGKLETEQPLVGKTSAAPTSAKGKKRRRKG